MTSFSQRPQRSVMQALDESPVTYLVLIANLTLYGLTWQQQSKLEEFGPEFAHSIALLQMGAQNGVLVQDGELWRLVSNVFLHHDLLHLGFNSFALWSFGPGLERELGPLRFGILYLVSGICGSVLAGLAYGGGGLLAGGSGAVFGLIGALLAIALRHQRRSRHGSESVALKRLLGVSFAYLAIGFLIPFISGWAHLGGFLAGFALLSCFFFKPFHPKDRSAWILRGALVATLFAMTARVLHPVEDPWYQLRRMEAAPTKEQKRGWRAALDQNLAKDHKLDRGTFELLKRLEPNGQEALRKRGLE